MNTIIIILVVFGTIGLGIISVLGIISLLTGVLKVAAAVSPESGSRSNIDRFDDNSTNGGSGCDNHHHSAGSDFGDCGDSGGDSGCDS
jgi:hypothetical protein